ncbi:MAG: hypothetical protein WKG07_43890 [Hymenobacter sp.]
MAHLFINPVELLGLGATPLAELDGAAVRKARTRLRHELQLSDAGTIAYHGQQLDQSAVEMACADLDNPVRLRLWYRLAHMPALNTFLATGQSAELAAGNAEYNGSLPADAELLDLIGSRYAEQYDRALAACFPGSELRSATAAGGPTPAVQTHAASSGYPHRGPDAARSHCRMRAPDRAAG